MNTNQISTRNLDAIAWGAFFVWWGVTELFPGLPAGIGAIGVGIILIGLNVARSSAGLRASAFSTTLGVLALLWGGLELARPVLHLSFELPVFAILLIVFGVFLMGNEVSRRSAA